MGRKECRVSAVIPERKCPVSGGGGEPEAWNHKILAQSPEPQKTSITKNVYLFIRKKVILFLE